MKRLLLIFTIVAICIGFCSSVMAGPTLPEAGSSQPESPGTYEEKKDKEFFLLEWLYWLLDDVLGIKDRDKDYHYYPAKSGSSDNSGDSSSGYGSGDYGWGSGSGDDGSGSGSGDDGSGSGSGDGGWGSGSSDGGWDSGSGDGGWGSGSGDGGWGTDTGDGGWGSNSDGNGWYPGSGNSGWGSGDMNTNPVQTIPAPGALILCGIGSGIVSWLRRRRML